VRQRLINLSILINGETRLAIKELQARSDINVTEVIRRAIAIYKFVADEQDKGNVIVVQDKNGRNKQEMLVL